MGALSVVLGLAAAPGSAMAQDPPPDTTAPTITIASPLEGAQYTVGQAVTASYACADAVGVTECSGTVANDQPIDTAAAGPRVFTVTARDAAGNTATATRNYSVVVQDGGGVGGETPAALNLALGTAAAFSPFVPGLARDYTTALSANVLSTAGDATLSVVDPSPAHTGHLVNGQYFLPRALEVGATRPGNQPGANAPAPVGGPADPTTLVAWNGPVNEAVTLNFEQPIAASDALRTGPYSKTLTFTLSTTNP